MKEPRPADQSRPIYDELADRYDSAMRLCERLGLTRLRAAALGELPTDGRILEVGVGTGLNFRHYPREARGAAVELSFEMLRQARMKSERPVELLLVQARAESLPFADASFDAALATLVFCSVESPPQAFAELRRVVRAGGRVVLLEHVRPDNLLGPLFDCLNFCTVRLCADHFNRRTALEATRAGLSLVRVERHLLGCVQLIVCEV